MVGIYRYNMGLQFTGIIAKDEKSAWEFLDKTHGEVGKQYSYPVNRDCFEIKPLYTVIGDE